MMSSICYEIDTKNNQFIAYKVRDSLVVKKQKWPYKMIVNDLEQYKEISKQRFNVEGFLIEDYNSKQLNDIKFPILIKNSPCQIDVIFENYKEDGEGK